jgi:hypothetical protein
MDLSDLAQELPSKRWRDISDGKTRKKAYAATGWP